MLSGGMLSSGKKGKHSFLVKRCLIATLELNAIHCVIYMVRRYIVLYGGKSMEGNMCDNLDNGHSVCVCVCDSL